MSDPTACRVQVSELAEAPVRRLARVDDFPPVLAVPHAFSLGAAFGAGYLARNREGQASIVVPLPEAPPPSTSIFGALVVRAFPELTFDAAGSSAQRPAVTVECTDGALLPSFAVLASDLLDRVGAVPSVRAVTAVIVEWTDLLRPVGALGAEAELGLWGELTTLLRCPDVAGAVGAWHGPSGSAIDFVGGGVGLECKTARNRHHHVLGLDQALWGAGDVETYLVSLLAEEDPVDGIAVPALVDAVRARAVDAIPFEKALRRAGYRPEHAGSCTTRFALVRAYVFPMERVPRVHAVDPGVSHVRFHVALDPDRHGAVDEATAEHILDRLVGATPETR